MDPQQLKQDIVKTLAELDQLLAKAQQELDADPGVSKLRAEYDNLQMVKDFRAKVQSYNSQKTELMGALKAINIIAPTPLAAVPTEAPAAAEAAPEASSEAAPAASTEEASSAN
jgi:hypothetical protein